MKRLLIIFLGAFLVLNLIVNLPVLAAETTDGATLFRVHCAGCHPQGGNIIRRGKTLKQGALKKYKMDSLEAIKNLVANGKGNMSAFQTKLSTQEIDNVSAYVLEQAQKNWQ